MKIEYMQEQLLKIDIEDRFKGKVVNEFSGNSGKVFIIDHGENSYPRHIAAKTVKKKSSESIDLFLKECKKWSQGNSAFVATAFYIEKISDTYFLCLKACKYDLFRFITDSNLSKFGKLYIALQLCLGLKELDSLGIKFHQDFNPQNILVADLAESHKDFPGQNIDPAFRYKIQITDFGMANYFVEDPEHGARGGKFPYKAPEQYDQQKEKNGFNPDVFSLGIIIHMIITGYHPSGIENKMILKKNAKKPKEGWRSWSFSKNKKNSISKDEYGKLSELVGMCYINNPTNRPGLDQMITEIKNNLQSINSEQFKYMNTLTSFFQNSFFKSLRNQIKIYE